MSGPSTRAAGERLIAVFARYPARVVEGCPCCVSAADQAGLAAGSPDALRRYAHKAMTTWGDDRDFRHLLPALLRELGPDHVDLVVGKLTHARWHTWPADERAAVRGYLLALWQDPPAGTDVADLFDALLAAGLGVAELLDPLRDKPSVLAELVHAEVVNPVKRPDVVAWLRDPRTAAVLEEAFFATSDESYSRAVDELAWLA